MFTARYKLLLFLAVLLTIVVVLHLSAQASDYGDQSLTWGSNGPAVVQLQQDLTRLGFNTYGVDGIFDPNTYDAVIRFQKSRGIEAIGIAGPKTKAALNSAQGSSAATVSRSGYTNIRKYPKLSKVNGSFGRFHYRELYGGRIEIDPVWVAANIVTIKLPGLNKNVRVNREAADNFIKAFTYIKNGSATINGRRVPLLNLVKTMDGTFVARHVYWDSSNGLSHHSWGTAIDINASNHLRYVNPSREPNDPNVILWEKAFKPAGFSWGNSFNDSMHFELK